MIASARSLTSVANAIPTSSGIRASTCTTCRLARGAERSALFTAGAEFGLTGLDNNPTRDKCETTAANISNCFGVVSSAEVAMPVMLPPGLAKLSTKPVPTGSVETAMTIGIVRLACCTALMDPVVPTTTTSTCARTSSAASMGKSSVRPSAKRHSTIKSLSSISPSSRMPCKNPPH